MTSISNYSEAKYAPVRVSFIFILLFNFVLESCLKSSVSYSDKNESVNTDVDFCGGSGTVSDPYLICDQASLVELQNKFLNTPDYILYADKYYKQTSDINSGKCFWLFQVARKSCLSVHRFLLYHPAPYVL